MKKSRNLIEFVINHYVIVIIGFFFVSMASLAFIFICASIFIYSRILSAQPASPSQITASALSTRIPTYEMRDEEIIPFKNDNGDIIVTAKIGTQNVECLVDTGVGSIDWQKLKIAAKISPEIEKSYYCYEGIKQFDAHRAEIEKIQIGSFSIQNACTLYFADPPHPTLAWTQSRKPIQMILGNSAFRGLVMTIDYKRSVLILRRSNYDITKLILTKSDSLLNVEYRNGGLSYPDWPYSLDVKGVLENHEVYFRIDTGNYMGMEMNSNTKSKLPREIAYYDIATINGIAGVLLTETTLKPIHWHLGNISLQSPVLVTQDCVVLPDDVVYTGFRDLHNYRITIDYTRSKMLLQPNPIDKKAHPYPDFKIYPRTIGKLAPRGYEWRVDDFGYSYLAPKSR